MSREREEFIRALLTDFWASDWSVMDRFADDAVLVDPMMPGPEVGKEAILRTFKLCHEWAHLEPELKTVLASGRHAAAEFVVRGVVTVPLEGYGGPVVGARFEFGEADIFEFDDEGRVRRMSIYADVAGFNKQLEAYAAAQAGA